jgi:hypothetical protein
MKALSPTIHKIYPILKFVQKGRQTYYAPYSRDVSIAYPGDVSITGPKDI